MGEEPAVVKGFEVTKVLGRGRPKGSGCNIQLLNILKPGDLSSCVWGCSKKKARSIRVTAAYHGIKVKVRMLENKLYAIWRV